MSQELLYGINSILSLLRHNAGNRRIFEIIVNLKRKRSPSFNRIMAEASRKNIPLRELGRSSFFNVLKTDEVPGISNNESLIVDQGVIAIVSGYNYPDLDLDIKKSLEGNRVLVILDGITDVGNFGSILRNCSAFNVDGVIIPKRRSVEPNPRLSRISSGALEEIKIYRVTNLVRTIDKLKENRFWIYGTTLDKVDRVQDADRVEYQFPLAIVFGSEDRGMHRLVEESCDFLVRIKMSGSMQSLNVATASGIFLYILRKAQELHKGKNDLEGEK
jgi:23S rRNA (guanosine2251-2'-O)-methyltransferase